MNEKRTKINETEAEDGPFFKKKKERINVFIALECFVSMWSSSNKNWGRGE